MKSNNTKKKAQKTGTDWSFDRLLGTLGAIVRPECPDGADILEMSYALW